MSTAAHDGDGKLGPHQCSPDPRYLSRRQPAAHHPTQQPRLPAGARQKQQEQAQSPEAPQLVCADRKGKSQIA